MLTEGSRVGDYQIVSELGRGGMAMLYRARRTGPGDFSRDVAIKVTHRELEGDPEVVKMLLDEARLTACIQHPNVVHVEGVGEANGRHYIVMELIDGVTLACALRGLHERGQRLPVDLAVTIASQVAAGLQAAHDGVDTQGRPLNLIHRDVSPSNVILTRQGHVKLIDFGVAKAKHRLATTTLGSVKGKLAYMAPEQLALRITDRRVDVFALGTVLWESLALARLFLGRHDLQTMMNIREKVVPSLREHRDDVPELLDVVVQTMLARELEERFATAAAARVAMLRACPEALAVEPSAVADLVRNYADGPRHTMVPTEDIEDDDSTIPHTPRARD